MTYTLHHGDCLDILSTMADRSVDAIIADPPYGTTECKWDSVIPFEPMWKELKRIIKPGGAIAIFGAEPFSSALRLSNVDWFRYDWRWKKTRAGKFAQAPYRPMEEIELISMFSEGRTAHNARLRMRYNPQGLQHTHRTYFDRKGQSPHRNKRKDRGWYTQTTTNYPRTTLEFPVEGNLHPTQKPLALLEYLVKTYTHASDTVLDFTMGSGTTGEACITTGRDFIGIEKEQTYYDIAAKRLDVAAARMVQMELAV